MGISSSECDLKKSVGIQTTIMESSKVDMETSTKSSGSSELNNSWIILESDEAVAPSEDLKNKTVDPVSEIASFEVTAQNVGEYTNNKSDGESDGISIISESEFYNGSDDDSINSNSSDDNATGNTKTLKISSGDDFRKSEEDIFDSENSNSTITSELPPSFEKPSTDIDFMTRETMTKDETPVELQETENVSSDEPMTSCDIPKEASRTTERQVNKTELNDKNILNSKLSNIFTIFSQFNVICIIGSILVALLASHITSESNKDSKLSPENSLQEYLKMRESDDVYFYCYDLHASYRDKYEGVESCVKKIMRRIETDKTFRFTDMIEAGKQYRQVKDDDVSNARCKELIAKLYPERSGNRQPLEDEENFEASQSKLKTNKKYKRLEKSIKYLKKRKATFNDNKDINDSGEKLHNEKKALSKWKKQLKRKEKKLIDWESTLMKREKKFLDESRNSEFKKSNDMEKEFNKKNYRPKNKEYKSSKQLKKNYKDKKPQTENYKQMKNKMHQIHVQKSKVSYNTKKNETSAFHDDQITGEWYINLSQSRNDLRKKDGKASWWFDRANFRKIKRDKAHWYFQYMFNREDLRYHKNI